MIDGLNYVQAGQGAETVVCLHGIGGDARSFHHQLSGLDGYRVIAWNMPGYQGSEVRKTPPDFEHLSARLTAFVAEIGGKVHLVGQSIGGMIAIEHALRHPDQVLSLCLVATTPRFGGRDETFKTAFLKARLDPLENGQSMAEMARLAAPRLVGAETDPLEIERIETSLADVPEATWRDILQCLVSFDRADELSRIVLPTLVVAGREDRNAPVKTMQKMAAAMSTAHFHVFEGTGHMINQEKPEAFNALLLQFLNKIPRNDRN